MKFRIVPLLVLASLTVASVTPIQAKGRLSHPVPAKGRLVQPVPADLTWCRGLCMDRARF